MINSYNSAKNKIYGFGISQYDSVFRCFVFAQRIRKLVWGSVYFLLTEKLVGFKKRYYQYILVMLKHRLIIDPALKNHFIFGSLIHRKEA